MFEGDPGTCRLQQVRVLTQPQCGGVCADEQAFGNTPTNQDRVVSGRYRRRWRGIAVEQVSDGCQCLAGPQQVELRFGVDQWPPPVRTIAGSGRPMDQQPGCLIQQGHGRQSLTGVAGEGRPRRSKSRAIQSGDIPHDHANLAGCLTQELINGR